ncbi:hypothetical protein HK405_010929 [Cladochytrium tenue]|nr:hypothetical protein HK405_010929 [Cladochytrium tenue]
MSTALVAAAAATLVTAAAATLVATASTVTAAATVCALYCDTRDPSQAQSEAFPTADVVQNGRTIRLHVSDADGMAWASIDGGSVTTDDSVWLDRSWDGGATWDGLLGKAWIPATWTGTRTLMYNIYDPAGHRRGVVRACGDSLGVVCTAWTYAAVCGAAGCDGATGAAVGDYQPVNATMLNGRTIALHMDASGMAWGALSGGTAGDQVWLDRSWDGGASWPDGSSLGRVTVGSGSTTVQTTRYNVRDVKGRMFGGAVRACGVTIEGENGSCTVWSRPSSNRTAAATDALMYSYNITTGWWPSSWWNSAVALSTLVEYMRLTGDTTYAWVVEWTYVQNSGVMAAGVKSGDADQGGFITQATDDTEWWALAWVDAYDLTGNATYLQAAVTIAEYVTGLWDATSCGGGVWWNTQRTYKNAITNGLFVRLTAALHNRIPGDTEWLGWASKAWAWYAGSGLINSAGLVNDGLTSSCANNGQTVWTYNQGMAMGAAAEVWRATGNTTALAAAGALADAALASGLVVGGLLTESCDGTGSCDDNQKQFKGIFMRNLQDVYAAATASGSCSSCAAWAQFTAAQMTAIWGLDRDALNELGERWGGASVSGATGTNVISWRTQASGLSALLAAVAMQ